MTDQPVRCQCGHRRANHWNRDGQCMGKSPLGRRCSCPKFDRVPTIEGARS